MKNISYYRKLPSAARTITPLLFLVIFISLALQFKAITFKNFPQKYTEIFAINSNRTLITIIENWQQADRVQELLLMNKKEVPQAVYTLRPQGFSLGPYLLYSIFSQQHFFHALTIYKILIFLTTVLSIYYINLYFTGNVAISLFGALLALSYKSSLLYLGNALYGTGTAASLICYFLFLEVYRSKTQKHSMFVGLAFFVFTVFFYLTSWLTILCFPFFLLAFITDQAKNRLLLWRHGTAWLAALLLTLLPMLLLAATDTANLGAGHFNAISAAQWISDIKTLLDKLFVQKNAVLLLALTVSLGYLIFCGRTIPSIKGEEQYFRKLMFPVLASLAAYLAFLPRYNWQHSVTELNFLPVIAIFFPVSLYFIYEKYAILKTAGTLLISGTFLFLLLLQNTFWSIETFRYFEYLLLY